LLWIHVEAADNPWKTASKSRLAKKYNYGKVLGLRYKPRQWQKGRLMVVSELFRRKQNYGTSVKVDAVAPAKAALRECRLADCLELRSGEAIIGMPDGDTPAIVSERLGRSVEYLDTPDAKPQEDFEDVLSGRR